MQHRYDQRSSTSRPPSTGHPLVWHEASQKRFSRKNGAYRARAQRAHRRVVPQVMPKKQIFRADAQRRRQKDSLTRLLPKLLIALAAFLVLVAGYGALSDDAAGSGSAGAANVSKSTDRDQWTKGKMPYLYQTDPVWAASPYAGSTVAESGCGPTCMSMAYVYLTGKKDRDPAQMAAFSDRNGFTEGGMTTWAFMTEGARMLGLDSEEVPADESAIRAELAAGHPVIVSVSAGDFTTKGHFIVLEGVDSFGRILVRDPNSPERSGQAWDLGRILSQTRNLWVLSV